MILYPDGRVEGTAEEIAKWKEMQENKAKEEHYKKFTTGGTGYINGIKDVISWNRKGKCPNEGQQCFCTGVCM